MAVCIKCKQPTTQTINDYCPECWRTGPAVQLKHWLENIHGFNFNKECNMPIEREAKTHKDYRNYKNLEPRDFTRIHDADLDALRKVLRECWKDYSHPNFTDRRDTTSRLFAVLNYDEPKDLPTTEFEYLAITAHFWGKGSTPEEAFRKLKRAGGESGVDKVGYVIYLVHPDTSVNPVDGGLVYPREHPPTQVLDKLKKKKKKSKPG